MMLPIHNDYLRWWWCLIVYGDDDPCALFPSALFVWPDTIFPHCSAVFLFLIFQWYELNFRIFVVNRLCSAADVRAYTQRVYFEYVVWGPLYSVYTHWLAAICTFSSRFRKLCVGIPTAMLELAARFECFFCVQDFETFIGFPNELWPLISLGYL